MKLGKSCPNCDVGIGVWPVFSASLPSRIWCRHCSARLRYRDIRGLILCQVVLAIVIAGIVASATLFPGLRGRFFNIDGFDFAIRLIVFCVLTLGASAPVELTSAWFLRSNKTLECIAKPSFQATASVCPMCGQTIKPGVQACVSCGESRTASQKSV